MAEVLMMAGFLGGAASIVWFIVQAIRRKPKKPAGIGFLICFLALIVGSVLYSPESSKKDEENSTIPPSVETTLNVPELEPTQEEIPELLPNEEQAPESNDEQSVLVGTNLFEEIYVPYAEREKAVIFHLVKEYAPQSGYEYEITEPSDNTVASIKFKSESDYVYIAFAPGIEDIELMMIVSYYQASTDSEVSMSNYSTERSPAYDKFQTHVIGEQENDVEGIKEQREFLFQTSP